MSFNNFTLELLNRKKSIFVNDLEFLKTKIKKNIKKSNFLVLGAAGTIGQAVTKEIFKRNPNKLHVVDISENNLVELVRDLRSSIGYIDGDFKTFAIDCGEIEFESMVKEEGPYDYVLNLSALKHVRSEKDPYTLMRLISVNIINTIKTLEIFKKIGVKKYFCVSTDKAANPVNMMGASKRIMELFLFQNSEDINISMARFANVAFSDGSLLHGFNQRFLKEQPFSAPDDVERYFISPQESGELCLMSCLLGENKDIFFPKLSREEDLIKFSDIALKYLEFRGFEPVICSSEDEARNNFPKLYKNNQWPCYFFSSDTTGEKSEEEFYTGTEQLDLYRFERIGVIKNEGLFDSNKLNNFLEQISFFKKNRNWSKQDLLNSFKQILNDFNHDEKGKFLDDKM
jgi:FlaA1/EpsC-like NDP-sugar epimerase